MSRTKEERADAAAARIREMIAELEREPGSILSPDAWCEREGSLDELRELLAILDPSDA